MTSRKNRCRRIIIRAIRVPSTIVATTHTAQKRKLRMSTFQNCWSLRILV